MKKLLLFLFLTSFGFGQTQIDLVHQVKNVLSLGNGGTGSASGPVWSSFVVPSGNLSLAMGSNTSIFTTTTAQAQMFAWKNTTAAVVGTSQGSPILSNCGTAFHGSASVEDCVTLSELPGNGNDAAIAFNIGHTGTSTGTVTLTIPLALAPQGGCSTPSYAFVGVPTYGIAYDPTGGRTGLQLCTNGGQDAAVYAAGIEIQGGMIYGFAPSTNPDTNSDTAISRGAAGFIKVGNGSANNAAGFIKTAQTIAVTGADVTCGTGGTITSCVAMQTITGLTATLPLVAANWSFTCDLVVGQATAAAANQIGVQTATNGATNLEAAAIAYTAAAVSTAAAITGVASTTTAQSVVTFTPGATGTKMPIHLQGTIEGSSASGTVFNVTALTGAAADLLTIYRGSSCYVY